MRINVPKWNFCKTIIIKLSQKGYLGFVILFKDLNFVSKKTFILVCCLLLNQRIEQPQFGLLLLVQSVNFFNWVPVWFQQLASVDLFEVVFKLFDCSSQLFLLLANSIEMRVQLIDAHRMKLEVLLKGFSCNTWIRINRRRRWAVGWRLNVWMRRGWWKVRWWWHHSWQRQSLVLQDCRQFRNRSRNRVVSTDESFQHSIAIIKWPCSVSFIRRSRPSKQRLKVQQSTLHRSLLLHQLIRRHIINQRRTVVVVSLLVKSLQ